MYLMNKPNTSGRIIIWLLLLQEFNSTILDKPQKHNVVAKFVSRLTHVRNKELVDDAFPYAHLFSILVKVPWCADIVNSLAYGKFPQHFNHKQ